MFIFDRFLVVVLKILKEKLFIVMFDVYHVVVREDEEKEKYNLENLIEFNTNRRVEPFKFWFGKAPSLILYSCPRCCL